MGFLVGYLEMMVRSVERRPKVFSKVQPPFTKHHGFLKMTYSACPSGAGLVEMARLLFVPIVDMSTPSTSSAGRLCDAITVRPWLINMTGFGGGC